MSNEETKIENKEIKILLIEDNEADIRYIQELLKEAKFKFSLQLVSDLASGIQLIKEKNFDVILLDLNLPDSLGLETFNTIMPFVKDTPIVVLTGLRDEHIVETTLKKGAIEYVMKSNLSPEYLSNVILYSIEKYNFKGIK